MEDNGVLNSMCHRAELVPVIFCHLSPSFFAISVVASSGLLLLIFCNGEVSVNFVTCMSIVCLICKILSAS